jgi:hypothetical protein
MANKCIENIQRDHQWNANRKYIENPFQPSQNDHFQENKITNAGEDVGERESYTLLMSTLFSDYKLVQTLKSVWRILKKLKTGLPYDHSRPFLGLYSKACKSAHSRDSCTPVSIVALLTISKFWNLSWCLSTNEWIKQMWHVYTCSTIQP